jgi:hypothetical protein
MIHTRALTLAVMAAMLATAGISGCQRAPEATPGPALSPTPLAHEAASPRATAAMSATSAPPDPATGSPKAKGRSVTAAAGPRDPFLQPFSSTSVWNTPIGSGAKYAETSIGSTGIGVDTVHIHRVSSSDPVVDSFDAGAFVGKRCDGSKPQQQAQWHPGLDKVRIPAGLLFPDANLDPAHYFTPNGKLNLLMPDGKTLRQFLPACRRVKGGPLYGYAFPPQNIYGDGLCCGHGGSALSALGGTLRSGELTGDEPIRHALAVNLWGNYLNFDHAVGTGHVWPASMHDGGAPSTYKGTDPNLKMGALLAIPPSVTEGSLRLETKAGRKLFRAMQDYGTYVVDDSGQNTQDLNVEKSAEDELVDEVTGGRPVWQYAPLGRDFTKLMKHVQVVVNNSPASVGGGGTPRAALAPPIEP